MKFQKNQNKKNAKGNDKPAFKTDNKINKKKFGKPNNKIKANNINEALKTGNITIDKKGDKGLFNKQDANEKGKGNKKNTSPGGNANVANKQSPNSPNRKQNLQKFAGTASLDKQNNVQTKQNGLKPAQQQNNIKTEPNANKKGKGKNKNKPADNTNAQSPNQASKKENKQNKNKAKSSEQIQVKTEQNVKEEKQVTPTKSTAQVENKETKRKQEAAKVVNEKKAKIADNKLSNDKSQSTSVAPNKKTKKKKRTAGHKLHYLDLKMKVLAGDKDSMKQLEDKITYFAARPPSKTNKRRLRTLKQILTLVQRGDKQPEGAKKPISKPLAKKQNNQNKAKVQMNEGNQNKKATVKAGEESAPQKVKKELEVKKEEDVEEEEDEEIPEVEESDDNNQEVDEEDDDDDDISEEDDDDEAEGIDEDESEDDNEVDIKKLTQNNKKTPNVKANQAQNAQKKVRYVVFVGNLPYDTDSKRLKDHFTKVSNVKHIRIPLEPKTNKPRGFAYVELETSADYEKALSLHHTQIDGRRINVLYTKNGKNEDAKKEIKSKNLKIQALRDQGKLTGSVKKTQKRSARRAKQRQQPQQ